MPEWSKGTVCKTVKSRVRIPPLALTLKILTMRNLIKVFLILFVCGPAWSQDLTEELRDVLEQPDTVEVNLKVYAPHYYLDSADNIQDYLAIRSEIEWYMLERVPEWYPSHEIVYKNCPSDNSRTESFLNTGGQTLPVSFRYRVFEPNTVINPTDNPRLVVYYYHCFDAIRPGN